MFIHRSLALLVLVLLLSQCAPTRYVVPLEKGEVAVTGSLGGPIFTNLGAPIPVPNTTVVVGYGFHKNITGYAGVHPTAAAFGVLQNEWGALFNFLNPDSNIAGLSGSLTANTAIGLREGDVRLWPQVDINLRWPIGPQRNWLYAGAGNWFEPRNTAYLEVPQQNKLIPAIQVGYLWEGDRLNYGVEAKWMAIGYSNREVVVDYVGVGQTGALGIYFYATRKWRKP